MFPNPNSRTGLRFKQSTLWFTSGLLFMAGPLRAQIQFAEDLFPELGRLIELASREGTELQISALRIEEQEGSLDVAVSQKRPQVFMNARVAGAYEMREDISDQFRGTTYANLTMTQALYHWGNLDRRQAVAEQRMTMEEVEVQRRAMNHFMQIRRHYLQWMLMNERKSILQQSIVASESDVNARRQLVDAGQVSEQDLLEMEARLLEKREALSHVEMTEVVALSTLGRLVGPSFKATSLTSQSLLAIQPMNQTDYDRMAAEIRAGLTGFSNPDIQRFEQLSEIESDNLDILDKELFPKLDLVAGVQTDQLSNLYSDDNAFRIQYFAGLQVRWNVFDGWRNDGYKRSTLARKRSFDLQESAAREFISQRIETLLADIKLNLNQIEARSKREVIIDRRQTLVREQVERNLLSASELVEVDIDYLEVRQRLMESRVNYIINLMELGLLMGKDPAEPYYQEQS